MGLIWGTWCPAVYVGVQMFESSGGQVNECSYEGWHMVGTMRQLSVCDALSLKQKAGWAGIHIYTQSLISLSSVNLSALAKKLFQLLSSINTTFYSINT